MSGCGCREAPCGARTSYFAVKKALADIAKIATLAVQSAPQARPPARSGASGPASDGVRGLRGTKSPGLVCPALSLESGEGTAVDGRFRLRISRDVRGSPISMVQRALRCAHDESPMETATAPAPISPAPGRTRAPGEPMAGPPAAPHEPFGRDRTEPVRRRREALPHRQVG